MNFTLISPRLSVQKGDFLGSGVPYWPVELAVLANFLKERGSGIQVFDLFGSDPRTLTDSGNYYLQGQPIGKFVDKIDAKNVIIYAISYMSHEEVLQISRELKKIGCKVFVLENSQAVTAYALDVVKEDFFSAGVDGLLIGEVYSNWQEIEDAMAGRATPPKNLITKDHPEGKRSFQPLEKYPYPAWELFPVKNYWKIPYSHGPKTGKFLPVLTSRGCPYPCNFCVVPATNEKSFRARKAADVADELIYLRDKFNVRHFQVEDLNPTVKKDRWPEISRILSEKKAGIFYYFVSGTKAETIPIEAVPEMAKGGCRYISISPESGSKAVMKNIGKPFDYDHGEKLIRACAQNGIYTQACFIAGHPSETEADHQESKNYLKNLIRAGLDEAAIFVVSPFAGSALYKSGSIDIKDKDSLVSFSPKGRSDWKIVERRRSELIRLFFIEKFKQGPKLWLQTWRSIFGHPLTKMENLPKRVLFVSGLVLKKKLQSLRSP